MSVNALGRFVCHWLRQCSSSVGGSGLLCLALGFALVGCQMAPTSELNAIQVQNRSLSEQNEVQLAEIDNLKHHNHQVEDKLIAAEEQLALSDQKLKADRARLANYESERGQLRDQYVGLARADSRLPNGVSAQLADLSRRWPSLQFDPQLGVAKLDTDVLFDSGDAQLKSSNAQVLADLADILQSPEVRQMRLMVVGHTDNQKIAGKEARQRFGENWQLSTSRALAVADYLQKSGVESQRMGVSGYGPQQPVASNATSIDRRRNRRVEIFLIAPETPIVGWTESTTSLY